MLQIVEIKRELVGDLALLQLPKMRIFFSDSFFLFYTYLQIHSRFEDEESSIALHHVGLICMKLFLSEFCQKRKCWARLSLLYTLKPKI